MKDILQPYRACVFDFDLTLADGSDWIVHCFQTVLHNNGYTDVPDIACRRTIGMTLENAFTLLTRRERVDEDIRRYRAEYAAVCRPQMAAHTRFYPEALALLRKLRQTGVRLAIVSTKMASVIRQTLRMYDIEEWFSTVIGVEEVSIHKPDPTGLFMAMQQLQTVPAETLYFGDNIIDAQTALNAGVPYVGVTTGMHTRSELETYPHVAVVDSLGELC